MKNILILVALFLVMSASYSQASLKGTITDISKYPFLGVNIILKGESKEQYKGTDSDFDGNFVINNITEGTYTVEFSYIGYNIVSKKVKFKNNETVSLAIILLESTETLQQVEIIGRKATGYNNKITFATRLPMAVKEAPIALNTTTKELLRDLNITKFSDAIKTLPSVVSSGSAMYGTSDFIIRGFDSGGYLLNGVDVNIGSFSPLELPNIERIEALMGGSSALYGSASPGGAINLVTKKPLDRSRNFLRFSTGSYETNRVEGDFTGPLDDDKKYYTV